jgi:hypothetical protein
MNDIQAYRNYPHLVHWYNKLWLAETMRYDCGPASIAPTRTGWYVVRPMMNLSGMGAGAKKTWIEAGDATKVPLGYFWCEWFDGRQYSLTYEWREDRWEALSSWEGIKDDKNLSKFHKWERSEFMPEIGEIFHEMAIVGKINIEFIENNPIEVHLRTSPNPDYDTLIPIWNEEEFLIDEYEKLGYTFEQAHENADGFLDITRLGFMVKNKGE